MKINSCFFSLWCGVHPPDSLSLLHPFSGARRWGIVSLAAVVFAALPVSSGVQIKPHSNFTTPLLNNKNTKPLLPPHNSDLCHYSHLVQKLPWHFQETFWIAAFMAETSCHIKLWWGQTYFHWKLFDLNPWLTHAVWALCLNLFSGTGLMLLLC